MIQLKVKISKDLNQIYERAVQPVMIGQIRLTQVRTFIVLWKSVTDKLIMCEIIGT